MNHSRNYTILGAAFALIALLSMQLALLNTPAPAEPVAEEQSEQVCYEPYGSNVEPQFLAQYAFVKIHYITDDLNIDGEPADGAAIFAYDPATGISGCEVWIPVPMQVLGDPEMDTIGHEFLHCIAGYFHGD